jgi:thiamine-phosphate pyrophosphorylase
VKALYVTDRATIGDDRFRAVVTALAGAPELSVQLREKGAVDRETLRWARACREWLSPAVPLFVNGRFDLALAAGADGVHLPADGLPPERVRANTPRGFQIGVSTHSAAEARHAIAEGAKVVVLGPVFATPSKRDFGPPLTPAALADLPPRSEHDADVLAIGGVDESNVELLEPYRDRIAGIAAVRLFQESADPRATAERIAWR